MAEATSSPSGLISSATTGRYVDVTSVADHRAAVASAPLPDGEHADAETLGGLREREQLGEHQSWGHEPLGKG